MDEHDMDNSKGSQRGTKKRRAFPTRAEKRKSPCQGNDDDMKRLEQNELQGCFGLNIMNIMNISTYEDEHMKKTDI
jgi:hypothetical protein